MELDQEMFYIAGMDNVSIDVAFVFGRLWFENFDFRNIFATLRHALS